MTRTVSRLSIPLCEVDRGPVGARLAATEGRVDGMPFDVIVTDQEMHFTFADRHGPRFAVDLNVLAKETTNAIEILLGKTRGIK